DVHADLERREGRARRHIRARFRKPRAVPRAARVVARALSAHTSAQSRLRKEQAKAMAFEIVPLHPLFGAELRGADLRAPPRSELVRAVEDAVARYAVVVIPEQRIDDEQHIRFSRAFGPLELPPPLGVGAKRRRP